MRDKHELGAINEAECATGPATGRGRPPTHGARSQSLKARDLKRIERKAAAQSGVKLRDMTGTQRRFLRLYAEALRVVERLDTFNPDGSVNGNAERFLAACNTAGRALERLEASLGLARQKRSRESVLDDLARYRGSA